MPAIAENISLGLPVAIDRIDRELKKVWSEGEGAITRASMINLAVYSEEPDSLLRNTSLLARVTENHACRGIVIGANPRSKNDRIEAWISAHCHVGRAGTKQVCSEQISFLLEGAKVKLLPSIVFSQLDSDLPLYLWWQSKFAEPMDLQLWSWIDRLIYDSQTWRDFNAQMRLVETTQREAKQRIVLCDLNWTRLVHFRVAFAQFFDHPSSHHRFREIESGTIVYGKNFRSTAILFIGWLAAQLDWQIRKGRSENGIELQNSARRPVQIELQENPNEPIGSLMAHSTALKFEIRLHPAANLSKASPAKPIQVP